MRSAEQCQRWTVARGALRCILATYARSEPRSLALQAGPHGKPELVGPGQDIPFNLAHTEGLALLAIAGSGRVGSDAEVVRVGIEMEDMSRRFFAPTEADEILALAPEARLAAFFACWTRKEVFVKALGTGLSVPLDRFQVTVRADQPARLVSVAWDEPNRWSLVDLGEAGCSCCARRRGTSASGAAFQLCTASGLKTICEEPWYSRIPRGDPSRAQTAAFWRHTELERLRIMWLRVRTGIFHRLSRSTAS